MEHKDAKGKLNEAVEGRELDDSKLGAIAGGGDAPIDFLDIDGYPCPECFHPMEDIGCAYKKCPNCGHVG